MRAAWKSTECGIAPLFVSVILTSWPWRTWITGPGAPPAHAQAAYLTPGAIWTVMSVSTRLTSATGPAGAGGQRRGIRLVRRGERVGVRRRGAGVARQGAACGAGRRRHAGHVRHELDAGGRRRRVVVRRGVDPHHQREEAEHGDVRPSSISRPSRTCPSRIQASLDGAKNRWPCPAPPSLGCRVDGRPNARLAQGWATDRLRLSRSPLLALGVHDAAPRCRAA